MPPATPAATDDKPEARSILPPELATARETPMGQWTAIPRPTTKSAVTMTHARVKVQATKKAESVSTMEEMSRRSTLHVCASRLPTMRPRNIPPVTAARLAAAAAGPNPALSRKRSALHSVKVNSVARRRPTTPRDHQNRRGIGE